MMSKKQLIHPLVAGILAAIVTIGYGIAYEKATAIEGEQLVSLREAIPMLHLFIAPIVGCLLASLGFFIAQKFNSKVVLFVFYFLFAGLSILTSFGIFSVYNLHEEIQFTIYGYSMPMHYFPFLSWVAFKPLFTSNGK
tara:strand:+ start:1479 stop:1892 length:414 start_codon:yes stop_codon:yes gene_type:complete